MQYPSQMLALLLPVLLVGCERSHSGAGTSRQGQRGHQFVPANSVLGGPEKVVLLVDERATRLEARDLDSDGDIDLLITTFHPPRKRLTLVNDGTGRFTRGAPLTGGSGTSGTSEVSISVDFDLDGDLDLVTQQCHETPIAGHCTLQFLWNDDGVMRVHELLQPTRRWQYDLASAGPPAPLLVDIDLDGDPDLVYGARASLDLNTHRVLAAPPPARGQPWFIELKSAAGYGLTDHVAFLYSAASQRRHLVPGLGLFVLDPSTTVPLGRLVLPRTSGRAKLDCPIPASFGVSVLLVQAVIFESGPQNGHVTSFLAPQVR